MSVDTHITQKIEAFFTAGLEVRYKKGEIITHAGEDPRGISLLLEGLVEQYDSTPEGNHATVNIFKPQAFFPMSWAINRTSNEYFYMALTDTTLRWVDADKVVSFLKENPDVLFDLLRRVYIGTDTLLRRIVLASSGAATSRLAFELLIEAYRFGVEQGDGEYIVSSKRHELAARSGLARETVSRELYKLQEVGAVTLVPRGIAVHAARLEGILRVE